MHLARVLSPRHHAQLSSRAANYCSVRLHARDPRRGTINSQLSLLLAPMWTGPRGWSRRYGMNLANQALHDQQRGVGARRSEQDGGASALPPAKPILLIAKRGQTASEPASNLRRLFRSKMAGIFTNWPGVQVCVFVCVCVRGQCVPRISGLTRVLKL